ncbi:hypothetical protein QEH56_19475 [Pelagicoccus enzymogenes]|uniref:hypothetical protein n=1 Tax=Pelagicoccus enzymogenes TaxID=2773457 RepID=UPI00280FBEC4|nr:hypothetical protein [Pelagicoccus enzymogenes]MDQ8200354.1 hypothetical protein [Pelagicoccus enzymogenes]
MESERLRQLKQQKQLILNHLDWINQEIDRESIATIPSKSPRSNRLAEAIPEDREVASSLEIESSPSSKVASDLYQELGPDAKNAAAETRRGCLIISAVAFTALAALGAWVIYYY